MNELSRRGAAESDRDFLYELIKQALGPSIVATYGPWDDDWQRDNFAKTTRASAHEIIELDGVPVGCLLVERQSDSIGLKRILLLPEYQGRGLGRGLVSQLLAQARESGLPVRLRVFRVNHRARQFYEGLGFLEVGETETHHLMEYSGLPRARGR